MERRRLRGRSNGLRNLRTTCEAPLVEYCGRNAPCPTWDERAKSACGPNGPVVERGRCGAYRYAVASPSWSMRAVEIYDARGQLLAVESGADGGLACRNRPGFGRSLRFGPMPPCTRVPTGTSCGVPDPR